MLFLQILKVIGIILLVLLLLILSLILLVLFVPLRYSGRTGAAKEEKIRIDAEGGVSWLLSLFRLTLTYSRAGSSWQFRLAGFQVFPRKKKEKPNSAAGHSSPPGSSPAEKNEGARTVRKASELQAEAVNEYPGSRQKEAMDVSEPAERQPKAVNEYPESRPEENMDVSEPAETQSEAEQEYSGSRPEEAMEVPESAETQPEAGHEYPGSHPEETVDASEPAETQPEAGQEYPESQPEEAMEVPESAESQPEAVQEYSGSLQEDVTSAVYEPSAERTKKGTKGRGTSHKQKGAKGGERKKKQKSGLSGQTAKSRGESLISRIQKYNTPEMKDAISRVFSAAMRVLRHIFPRKLNGFVRFGFEDPSVTGMVSGVLGILYAGSEGAFHALPDFEEVCLEGDVSFSGRIIPGYIVFQGLKLLCCRNIRSQYKLIKREGKSDGKQV